MVHLSRNSTNLFPSDGSMISVKKNTFVKGLVEIAKRNGSFLFKIYLHCAYFLLGRTSLTTSIHKDDHVISLHLLNASTEIINGVFQVDSPILDCEIYFIYYSNLVHGNMLHRNFN